jgi:hypothetical protein
VDEPVTVTRSILDQLLGGPLWLAPASWPLVLIARLCDLKPRFLAKGTLGQSHRAVARNGRILLASHRPAAELADAVVQIRLQTWHKTILAGEAPREWGVLLCVRPTDQKPIYGTRLVRDPEGAFDLALELGGGLSLAFRRLAE